MKIPFIKAHGTGNDFIIFFQEECPKVISKLNFIKKICARRTGIGADGVIILNISTPEGTNYRYNKKLLRCSCANWLIASLKIDFKIMLLNKGI